MQHADFVLIYDFILQFSARFAYGYVIFVIACQNLKCFDIFCDVVAVSDGVVDFGGPHTAGDIVVWHMIYECDFIYGSMQYS